MPIEWDWGHWEVGVLMLGRRIPHNLVQTKSCTLSQVVVQIMVNQKASEGVCSSVMVLPYLFCVMYFALWTTLYFFSEFLIKHHDQRQVRHKGVSSPRETQSYMAGQTWNRQGGDGKRRRRWLLMLIYHLYTGSQERKQEVRPGY